MSNVSHRYILEHGSPSIGELFQVLGQANTSLPLLGVLSVEVVNPPLGLGNVEARVSLVPILILYNDVTGPFGHEVGLDFDGLAVLEH